MDDGAAESLVRYAGYLAARLRADPSPENAAEVVAEANRCENELGEGEPWRVETADGGRTVLIYRRLKLVRTFRS